MLGVLGGGAPIARSPFVIAEMGAAARCLTPPDAAAVALQPVPESNPSPDALEPSASNQAAARVAGPPLDGWRR